jgi:hypothetical protein
MRISNSKVFEMLSCVQVFLFASSVRIAVSGFGPPNGLIASSALDRSLRHRQRPRIPSRLLSATPTDAESRPLHVASHDVDEHSKNKSLSKCSITLVEPTTGCEVVLVGCFHGSPASAHDVAATLSSRPPNVLVLELCPDRFATIREQAQMNARNTRPSVKPSQSAWSSKRGDWALRGVDALLRFVSRAQSTFFSGLEPGLEFVTAVRSCPNSDIVLADQPVHETLYKLSRVPRGLLWNHGSNRPSDDGNSSPLQETMALLSALFGSSEVRSSGYHPVNLIEFGMRTRQAQAELLQSVVLPLILCAGTILTLPALNAARGVDSGAQSDYALDFSLNHHGSLLSSSSLILLAINVALVLTFYMGLVVPVVRVVLRERDDCLARGILAACQVAASANAPDEDENDQPASRRVTAILGLLHVNGVAQRLLCDNNENWEQH